jgi:O-antigen ligase/tetratricopeptide (TPR) repeat protein
MPANEPFPKLASRPGFGSGLGQLDRLLLRVVDAGLAGCIFVVPFLIGGRHPVGRLALVTLAVVVAVAWAVRQCVLSEATWRRSGVELLLLAGAAVPLVQLIPLPQSVLQWLAPHTARILPLWGPEGDPTLSLGDWSRISLTPAATRSALVMFSAYGLLFLVTIQRLRSLEDVERLLRWCGLSAVLMASFGLIQFLTTNGKYFWVYKHQYAHTFHAAKGGFTNSNHFAHFLALGIGPLIWWVQHGMSSRRRRQPGQFAHRATGSQQFDLAKGMRAVALGVVLFAVLLSWSRGGAIASFLAAVIGIAVCYRASSVGIKFAAVLGAVVLLISVCLAIFGYDHARSELGTLTSGSLETVDRKAARRTLWRGIAHAVPDFAAMGSGVGSHQEVYPIYFESTDAKIYFTHAENGYLQVALETGMPGGMLCLTYIGVCGFWCVGGLRKASSSRTRVCLGAVAASLAASVAHSVVDFVWYVPACMALIAVLAACACRLWQLPDDGDRAARTARRFTLPRPVGLAMVLVLMVGGIWMIRTRIGPVLAEVHWERFRALESTVDDTLPLIPGWEDPGPASESSREAALAAEQAMISELEEIVRWDPNHAQAHLRLAEAYMEHFDRVQQSTENVFSLGQIGDAAIESRSRFASQAAFDQWLHHDWLPHAIGEHSRYLYLALEHSRQALALCPLHGTAYLFLGELCFLEGGDEATKAACIAQALRVRPLDGLVLFHAGNKATLAGDKERGLRYLQRAFHSGRRYQEPVMDYLVGHICPEALDQEILFFLDAFQPDLHALRLLDRRYQEIAQPEQLVALQAAYARAAEAEARNCRGPQAAKLWMEAMNLYQKSGDAERSVRCARNALESNADDYHVRRRAAYCLADHGQLAEAEKHLRWCLGQKPNQKPLEAKLQQVIRAKQDRGGRATASRPMPGFPR